MLLTQPVEGWWSCTATGGLGSKGMDTSTENTSGRMKQRLIFKIPTLGVQSQECASLTFKVSFGSLCFHGQLLSVQVL